MLTMERKPFQDRFLTLQKEASTWKPAWTDIQRYIAPTRGVFDDVQANNGKAIDHKTIINGHATRKLGTMASGLTSGLTSPSRPWFRIGLADDELMDYEPVKEWLGIVQSRMMSVFSKSNFYGAMPTIYGEVGGFGTGAQIILPDFQDVIRVRTFTCGEYFLGIGPDGRVNSFGRRYWMTVCQMVKEFGEENVSDAVRNIYKLKTQDPYFRVIHLITPNEKVQYGNATSRGMAYKSVYWEEASPQDTFLRIGGYRTFPIQAPRWEVTTTSDVYGRSPGWHCLGDVKQLQKMEKDKLIALDKVVDPPVQADGNVADQVNTLPGGLTRSSAVSQNAGVRPVYQVAPDFSAIKEAIDATKQDISESFYADLFMMIAQTDRGGMTAREIVERHEEKLLMLGPVIERLESELLDPTIDRTFEIMNDAKLLPPAPAELEGMELKVEYISMLAQAQKMVGTTAIEQTVSFVGSMAAANPEALDKLDMDEAIDHYGDALGVPPKIIRSDEDVAAMREARAQEKKQAEVAATMPSLVTGAKTLSETKVGQNSALDAILAGAAGSPAPAPGA